MDNAQRSNPLNKMIQDAQKTSEIMQDAIYECFEYDADPSIVFPTALQIILATMLDAATDKKLAIQTAQNCITVAEMINEQQESTIH